MPRIRSFSFSFLRMRTGNVVEGRGSKIASAQQSSPDSPSQIGEKLTLETIASLVIVAIYAYIG